MRQSTSLLLTLALFAFLGLQATALPFLGGSSLKNTIMNAHATSSGIISLQKDAYSDGSFYVDADLSSSYYSSKSSKSPSNSTNSTNSTGGLSTTDSARFLVSIANTETMVSTYCLSFNWYDCSKYSCYNYGWTNKIDYPTFSANVQYARSYVYLDYTYWGLNSAYLYIAQSCTGGSATGSNRAGVIGLGTDASTKSDFTYEAIFSVLIDSDLQGGKLLMMKDSSYYQYSSPVVSFSANNTWQIQAYSGYIQVDYSSVSFSGNVMFDFNSDAIGLPANTFSSVLSYFESVSGVYCYSGYIYRPYCYTTNELKDLPDIILSVNGDDIKIPSQIYATLSTDSGTYKYFYFNFKATSPAYSGKNFVTPSFASSIILDANFMSYYYTVFDATSGYNYIYIYPSTNAPTQYGLFKWIAAGAVGALLLISLCCCCCCKKKKTVNNTITAAPLNNTTFNNTIQAPPVFNQGVVDNSAPYYSYDATNYNYAGYNYPTQPQGAYQQYPQYNQGYVAPPPAGDFQERAKQ